MITINVTRYRNIDDPTAKACDVRHTMPMAGLDELLTHMSNNPGAYAVVAMPDNDIPFISQQLLRGAQPSDVVVSADLVDPSTVFINLAYQEGDDWQGAVASLVGAGASVVAADGLDPEIARPLLPDGSLFLTLEKDVMPTFHLTEVELGEEGRSRYAHAVKARICQAFLHGLGSKTLPRPLPVMTCGYLDGWWDAYGDNDRGWWTHDVRKDYGFGAATLFTARLDGPYADELADMQARAYDLGQIWKAARADGIEDPVIEKTGTGKTLVWHYGVKPMADAYMAGVPVADVVA